MCLQSAEGDRERGISVAATHNNAHYLALPFNASHLFMGLKHPIASHVHVHVHRSPRPSVHHFIRYHQATDPFKHTGSSRR